MKPLRVYLGRVLNLDFVRNISVRRDESGYWVNFTWSNGEDEDIVLFTNNEEAVAYVEEINKTLDI